MEGNIEDISDGGAVVVVEVAGQSSLEAFISTM
jgi:hypothetical protein